jgi:hypothetical protein
MAGSAAETRKVGTQYYHYCYKLGEKSIMK